MPDSLRDVALRVRNALPAVQVQQDRRVPPARSAVLIGHSHLPAPPARNECALINPLDKQSLHRTAPGANVRMKSGACVRGVADDLMVVINLCAEKNGHLRGLSPVLNLPVRNNPVSGLSIREHPGRPGRLQKMSQKHRKLPRFHLFHIQQMEPPGVVMVRSIGDIRSAYIYPSRRRDQPPVPVLPLPGG